MATATKETTYVTKTIQAPVDHIVLRLTPEEAQVLRTLVGAVGGSETMSLRTHTKSIYSAIEGLTSFSEAWKQRDYLESKPHFRDGGV